MTSAMPVQAGIQFSPLHEMQWTSAFAAVTIRLIRFPSQTLPTH